MAIYKRKDSPYWWFSFKVGGDRIFECTGTHDKRLAEEIYLKKRHDALSGKFFPIRLKTKLSEMLDLYLNDYAKTSKDSYKHNLGQAKRMKEFFGNCHLGDITPHKLELYRAEKIGAGLSKTTVNRHLAFLSHVFTKAIEWGKWYGENPVRRIKKYKEELKPERYLTYQERERLFAASPDFFKPVILTALKAGLRLSEIIRLKWEDIDLERGIISVRHTKAKKLRQIPIHQSLSDEFSKLNRCGEYVFVDTKGQILKKGGIFRSTFEKVVRYSGIQNFTFHDLRHTFASELIMKGADIKTVQEYLGHSSVAVTERYLHVAPNQKKITIQLLGKEKGASCYAGVTFEEKLKTSDSQQLVKTL